MASVSRLLPAFRLVAAPRSQIWNAGARRAFSAQPSLLVKKYTPAHEWVELDESGKIATVGISEYAAKALGDVVFVELPEMELDAEKGEAIGAVESVKSASDIYAPVRGKVVETNSKLEETPALINKSPEGDGWLAKLEVSDVTEVEELMSKEEYDKLEKDS